MHNISIIFYFLMIPLQPRSTLFPYTTLFRSVAAITARYDDYKNPGSMALVADKPSQSCGAASMRLTSGGSTASTDDRSEEHTSDSSHQIISYAVFCLKKKKQ